MWVVKITPFWLSRFYACAIPISPVFPFTCTWPIHVRYRSFPFGRWSWSLASMWVLESTLVIYLCRPLLSYLWVLQGRAIPTVGQSWKFPTYHKMRPGKQSLMHGTSWATTHDNTIILDLHFKILQVSQNHTKDFKCHSVYNTYNYNLVTSITSPTHCLPMHKSGINSWL